MAIVLARPGTPSTRRWPRASSATASRSSSTSCPTMIFLTSYRTLSIGRADVAVAVPLVSWSTRLRPARSVLGQAGGAAGDVDGHGQADADEDVLLGRVDERGDDADDPAVAVEQRPARVARVDRRVDLDEVVEDRPAVVGLEGPAEAGDDAGCSSSRTARTGCRRRTPRCRSGRRPGCRAWPGRRCSGSVSGLEDRDVVLGLAGSAMLADDLVPSANVSLIVVAVGDDVEAGQDVALRHR